MMHEQKSTAPDSVGGNIIRKGLSLLSSLTVASLGSKKKHLWVMASEYALQIRKQM
jgi:hypothetical protein